MHNPLEETFRCSSGEEIAIADLCNGTVVCASGEDKLSIVCPGKSED